MVKSDERGRTLRKALKTRRMDKKRIWTEKLYKSGVRMLTKKMWSIMVVYILAQVEDRQT